MHKTLLALAVSGLSMFCCAAKADTFNFAATALGTSFSGVLTATNNNNGSYTVTGISGAGITGLIAPGDPFFGNDNLLFPVAARSLDVNGVAFTGIFGGQGYSVDLYSEVSGVQVLAVDRTGNITFDTATFAVSSATAATPEPSSLVLLGTGLLGLTAAARRRFV